MGFSFDIIMIVDPHRFHADTDTEQMKEMKVAIHELEILVNS